MSEKNNGLSRREFLRWAALTGSAVVLPGSFTRTALSVNQPEKGGTLLWGGSEPTQNLYIHQTVTATTVRILENIHEPLLSLDENFKIQPHLAQNWEVSNDLLQYTFYLRKGIRFHHGKELTAEDVKFSWERIKDPETAAEASSAFQDVKAITTPDKYTVKVDMAKPFSAFLARITDITTAILPKDRGDIKSQKEHPIGAGPFKFVEREFGNRFVMSRFEDYWGERAYLNRVEKTVIPEAKVRLTNVQVGKQHIINDVAMPDVSKVKATKFLQLKTWLPLCWAFLNFNHRIEPFNNRNVRLAFDYMIDKEALVNGALWGQGKPTASPSFPDSPEGNNELKVREQNFDKARKLLEREDYHEGDLNLVFKVTTNYPWHVDAAEIMYQWFKQAGVNITIEKLNWPDWISIVFTNKDFQLTMMNLFSLWEPDDLYYELWHTNGHYNWQGYSSERADKLIEEARYEPDQSKRIRLYKKLQTVLHEEVPDVMLWFRKGIVAAKPQVKGLDTLLHPDGNGFLFDKIWLAE